MVMFLLLIMLLSISIKDILNFFFSFFGFLGPHPWHMEVPRLGVKLELQLPACATTTAMLDPQPTELRPGMEPESSSILYFHCIIMGTPIST